MPTFFVSYMGTRHGEPVAGCCLADIELDITTDTAEEAIDQLRDEIADANDDLINIVVLHYNRIRETGT